MEIKRTGVINAPADPIVIVGTGGSGTRVVARIVKRGGAFLGVDVTPSEDAQPLARFSDTWANMFVQRTRLFSSEEYSTVELAMVRALAWAVDEHRGNLESMPYPWGWKALGNLLMVPFLDRWLPGMRLVHVVRDGRDLAVANNQATVAKFGRTFLTPEEWRSPQYLRAITLWSRANLAVIDYAEQHLAGRYLRVRLENLCAAPADETDCILRFLKLEGSATQIAELEVGPCESLGRWREVDIDDQRKIERRGGVALERFDYLSG